MSRSGENREGKYLRITKLELRYSSVHIVRNLLQHKKQREPVSQSTPMKKGTILNRIYVANLFGLELNQMTIL